MRCKNCKKKILQTPEIGRWYHKKTRQVFCKNPTVAEPNWNGVPLP